MKKRVETASGTDSPHSRNGFGNAGHGAPNTPPHTPNAGLESGKKRSHRPGAGNDFPFLGYRAPNKGCCAPNQYLR